MSTSITLDGVTYQNGHLPAVVLAPLDGQPDAFLWVEAAHAWNDAKAAVRDRTGIDLTVRGWYRTIDEQERFFHQRYGKRSAGGVDARWHGGNTDSPCTRDPKMGNTRYARHTGAPAARPGTSNHGVGTTVDVVDYGAFGTTGNSRRNATIAILREYGWTDEEGQSIGEPWHLEYVPSKNRHKRTSNGKGFLMALTDKQQEDLADQVEQLTKDVASLLIITKETRTKVKRLEADEAERRAAARKHESASAGRERETLDKVSGGEAE